MNLHLQTNPEPRCNGVVEKISLRCGAVLLGFSLLMTPAQAQQNVAVDSIVAVVDDAIITRSEFDARLIGVLSQFKSNNTPVPDEATLKKQLLQRMITEQAILNEAKRRNIIINDAQLDAAIASIAKENKITPDRLRDRLRDDHINWQWYRNNLRNEITISQIREAVVDPGVTVSDTEIGIFLEQETAVDNKAYNLQHILIRAPEASSEAQMKSLRMRADEILKRAKAGGDFKALVKTYSDASDAKDGGDLGMRKLNELPTIYADNAKAMQVGEVSQVLRSPAGLHIIKLTNVTGQAGGAVIEDQAKARHIILRVRNDQEALKQREEITGIRQRITSGEISFENAAKQYSEDLSATTGGDLGWVRTGQMVPEFETAMNKLAIDELSPVIQTRFGWHLVKVEARRKQDVTEQVKTDAARKAILERKRNEAFDKWVESLRSQSYVNIRPPFDN